ncbi:CDF-like metal transporter [Laccaria bicolor S238N-H82]|uniref:CDF-like metal transporter n=1 Tax=Laccaria bicolor (strain S238N-H82 / ATCC MYA-4686) TaxID=486041 RepID=B0DI95_LACBS|nr:CDF-like metal transporter [Laccaria bicolor S238N-H82]EDR05535.1 CDF-like metal transporter [Laccaria bicolor S238N-H82]|eukprot:XP_001883639.1 CDF-like metal transporter [Laccaria bicolor S238N-H82]
MYPESIDAFSAAPRTPTSRLIRLYLKTILSNPESRKIFYFLMLNLSYMLVQMLYGVWTNSLGLISDAIHMAFDCMAIGVGLFASVMATWEPNESFTYGYGRIETLSGFANGIFLILISIFIVFEAIQRLLEPPEMNTSQLLLDHSHSHSSPASHSVSHSEPHSHSHSSEAHTHSHTPQPKDGHDHTHGHSSATNGHNMRGVFLHVMADTLGSVGVIISTLLIQFYGWTGFDPIASLFIAILIAASVFPLVVDTGKVLALDVADRDLVIQQALAELSSIEGVASYDFPRFWPKDATSLIGSIHIHLVPTTYTRIDRVVERVDALLREKIPGLQELTIQVEGKQAFSASS